MRIHLRTRHYSIRTEEAYIDWARRFIVFRNKPPAEYGVAEVEASLSHLAVDRQVSAATQNQAKAALLYLYKQVLAMDLPWLKDGLHNPPAVRDSAASGSPLRCFSCQ